MNFENTIIENLGIDLQIAENPQRLADNKPILASMPVDKRTATPFNTLCGGASLTLAECLAGYGSSLLCKEEKTRALGIQVSGNHVASANIGEKVEANAQLVHKGKSIHVWTIVIKDEKNRIISTISVTNMIIGKE